MRVLYVLCSILCISVGTYVRILYRTLSLYTLLEGHHTHYWKATIHTTGGPPYTLLEGHHTHYWRATIHTTGGPPYTLLEGHHTHYWRATIHTTGGTPYTLLEGHHTHYWRATIHTTGRPPYTLLEGHCTYVLISEIQINTRITGQCTHYLTEALHTQVVHIE